MSEATELQVLEFQILSRVCKAMDWGTKDALIWYNTENPFFGGSTPRSVVQIGRGQKVLQFVEGAEREACLSMGKNSKNT